MVASGRKRNSLKVMSWACLQTGSSLRIVRRNQQAQAMRCRDGMNARPGIAEPIDMDRRRFLYLASAGMVAANAAEPPAAPKLHGANLQRSMNLMAGSTGLKRNTVRVLFYGQSITAADWTKIVAERLRRQYPLTDFIIENRAIGGFNSERLVRTAEADLYPFFADLVIFHNYGSAGPIDEMIRKLRERTVADILICTDHLAPNVGEKLAEETDPLKLREPKPEEHDAAWRSFVFLPALARKYGAELADVRTAWKQHLRDRKLGPSDFLIDDLHLNRRGNELMADIIGSHLRHRPDLAPHFEDRRVRTFVVGEDMDWKNGKLVLPFDGNKVDLICREGADANSKPATIHIDGKKPSDFAELYMHSRTEMNTPFSTVPPVLRVFNDKPLQVESWTIDVTGIQNRGEKFRFRLTGSLTGEDGIGESGKRFVSKSGRVVIEALDFGMGSGLLFSQDQDATTASIQWKVLTFFADEFVPPKRNPFGDTVVTAAQGLVNGRHVLEISGGPETPLAAIRVYRPSYEK
jgi:hypothetical protein